MLKALRLFSDPRCVTSSLSQVPEMDLNGLIIVGLSKVGLARKIIFADRYLGEERPVLSPDALTEPTAGD